MTGANPLRDDELEEESFDAEEEGVSLEELSQSYARLMVHPNADAESHADADMDPLNDKSEEDDPPGDDHCPVSPQSIIEAVLLVGRPDNEPITASDMARLMRGVDEAEVEHLITEINRQYEDTGRAFRIVASGAGYRLQLADDLEFLTDMFYGRVKPIRLNQAAIDILALVVYQPGISREKLDEQRGQGSGGLLNQLVRRQLLEMRREGENNRVPCYYPTERLTQLAGLESLEDLPLAEDWE
jgi:segregation and condensation protein B